MEQVTQHHLTAQLAHDKFGPGLLLSQQDGLAEEQTIYIHPAQMRLVCEQLGIIAPDESAARTIAALQRRMAALRDRLDRLAHHLANHSDSSAGVAQAQALADLAGEWCAEFEPPSPEPVEPAQAALL